jgi:hypothetical protein
MRHGAIRVGICRSRKNASKKARKNNREGAKNAKVREGVKWQAVSLVLVYKGV